MKNILLLYPRMFFYKISIFNKLDLYLRENGYNLIVWYRSIEDPNGDKQFCSIENEKLTLDNYIKVLNENNVHYVINILFKSDPGYYFYISSIFYTIFSGRKVIFYGHGINKQKDNIIRNFIYNLTYVFFNGIILYTPNEKEKLWKMFHKKITIANNTLDIENARESIVQSKEELKRRYGISSEKLILTTGRLHSRKKIDLLANIFLRKYSNRDKIGWIIVGPDIENELKNKINGIANIYYLGPIFDKKKISEIFYISDIFCIPGALGIAVVEAIYWGLPVLTLNVKHGPELYYLKNNKNGYITENLSNLEEKLELLLNNDFLLRKLSDNALEIYENNAKLDKMFSGFKEQLDRFS